MNSKADFYLKRRSVIVKKMGSEPIKKKDLTYTAKSVFQNFIKDPSNKDKKFLRTKIRLFGRLV